MDRMSTELEQRYAAPRDRLLGIFEVQGLSFTDPAFRGCAFVNAKAEARAGGVVDEVAADYRAWLHDLFAGLACRGPGAPDPKGLSRQLVLLYDGAGIKRLDGP